MTPVPAPQGTSRVVDKKPMNDADAKWIGLKALRWVDPSGRERLWECADRKTRNGEVDAVAIFAMVRRGNAPAHVLLVSQFRPPVGQEVVELPAGLVDAGEESDEGTQRAALRELGEETGFKMGSDGTDVTVRSTSKVMYNDPGLSGANMKLCVVDIALAPDAADPVATPDAGEYIEKHLVPICALAEQLDTFMHFRAEPEDWFTIMDGVTRLVSSFEAAPGWQQVALVACTGMVAAICLNVAAQLLLPRNKSLPPVVFHWMPVIGSAVTYGMDPYKFFFTCREKYGDVFTFVLLGRKVTVALGPKGSNLVFNGRLNQVSAEEAYTSLTTPVFGKHVVYDVPNAVLMEQKRFVKAGLSVDNFRAYVGQIVAELEEFFRTDSTFLPLQHGAASVVVDIFKAVSEITILTASRTLQGKEVREGLDKSFAQLYHDLDSGFTPINFVIPNLPLPSNFRRDRAQRQMSEFYHGIIAKRRTEGGSMDTEHDMISALMEQAYKNGREIKDVEIAHMMIALLMAGQHTSSATGSWALLRLASHPEMIQELYEEQQRVYDDGMGGFLPLDYDVQKTSVPLLDAVVRETLRLHPPIHSIMRKVKTDIPVPATLAAPSVAAGRKGDNAPYIIPKGHYVMAAPGVSQVDPDIWEDSDRFNPYRWLGQQGKELDSGTDEQVDFGWGMVSAGANSPYLPFGAGRHRCIGEQFAYLQLGTIIATFVRTFDWRLETTFPDPDYTSMVVLPTSPSNIVLTPRKN
ncbi:sterol 14alpha-demethylase [Malassezia sp. CBS 17886]|nr:sterol 14alpha-demethylase [Malassezia sp. CBS 17886]